MHKDRRNVLTVVDSDSYLKWAAGLVQKADPEFANTIVTVQGSGAPSANQVEGALRTTDWTPADVRTVNVDDLGPLVAQADVLLLAVRGAMAMVIGDRVLKRGNHRPVVVTGLPGMSIPAKRKGLVYRSYADLFVLHAKAEIAAFEELAQDTPLAGRFALATLPFVSPTLTVRHDAGGPFVFATQAIVPETLKERRRLALGLVEYAKAHRTRELVIKVRNLEGEAQTHADTRPIQRLMAEVCDPDPLPQNVSVKAGAMVDVLDGAAGLITVSSTAALEALEYGMPVALVSDFGVRKTNLNVAFADSGLLTRLRFVDEDVTQWPRPDQEWLSQHYFHEQHENTWRAMLHQQISAKDEGRLRDYVFLTDTELTKHQRLYWSATALTVEDRSQAQLAAVRKETSRRARRRKIRLVRRFPMRVVRRLRRAIRWRLRRVLGLSSHSTDVTETHEPTASPKRPT